MTLLRALLVLALIVPTPALAGNAPPSGPKTGPLEVAVVVHEGVQLLDFAGPLEVFHQARDSGGANGPALHVFTVAPSHDRVVTHGNVTVVPEFSIADCPEPDVLVIPGGATQALRNDEGFMAWVRARAPRAEIAFSVCTGAFVLAECGFLDGRAATTHWSAINGLRREFPEVDVKENVRFVDNGTIVTSAGISAGIDGALHVVARLLGRHAAEKAARDMEYDWSPKPEDLASYPLLNPRLDEHGRLLQGAGIHRERAEWAEAEADYRAVLARWPRDPEATYRLGQVLHVQGRLDEAIPLHRTAAGFEEVRTNALYNLACAHALQGHRRRALSALRKAADAGFWQANWVRSDSDWASLHGDKELEEILGGMRSPYQ